MKTKLLPLKIKLLLSAVCMMNLHAEESITSNIQFAGPEQVNNRIEEDKKENIYTIPVLYGENLTICFSHISILFGVLLFTYNDLHDYEFIKIIFFLQNFGTFFLNNKSK